MPTNLRPAECRDSSGLIRLIGSIFAEYPGCVMEVENEEAGLLSPGRSHDRFWVVEKNGMIVGCAACRIDARESAAKVVEVKKVYLHPSMRGQGWGRRLVVVQGSPRGQDPRGRDQLSLSGL